MSQLTGAREGEPPDSSRVFGSQQVVFRARGEDSLPFAVLVIEPEADSRNWLLSLLSALGATTDTARSLPEGRARLDTARYDLVFADVGLAGSDQPGLSGLFEQRREYMPLILTSDCDTVQARSRARDAEALGFLVRPYDEGQTRALVVNAMTRNGPCSSVSARAGEPPRILMYSHDSIGLGHMRRNANIASEILRVRPDASVLMLLGCPAGLVFELPRGVDFVKLPSLVKLSRDEWRPDRLGITGERLRDLRERLIREAIAGFDPNLILVDHMPAGVWNELTGVLGECRRGLRRADIVLGLRDILDAPEATRQGWRKTGADRAIAELYDELFIYGEQRLFNTARIYDLDALAPGRVSYVGYVSALARADEACAIRARLAPADRPLVLISGGGGRDAFPVISSALSGLAGLPEDRRPAALVVAGPLMAPDLRTHLRHQAEAVGAAYRDRVANFPTLLAASDFLLGMGGYNSAIEAAAAGVPALLVPRRGPSAEQLTRARIFAARGLADMVPPDMATAEVLGARLGAVRRIERRMPRLEAEGARVAAARILERIEARSTGGQLALAVS